MTRGQWIVIWCHSRSLHRGRPFVPMPDWLNKTCDRCKRRQEPTVEEYERFRSYVRSVLSTGAA